METHFVLFIPEVLIGSFRILDAGAVLHPAIKTCWRLIGEALIATTLRFNISQSWHLLCTHSFSHRLDSIINPYPRVSCTKTSLVLSLEGVELIMNLPSFHHENKA